MKYIVSVPEVHIVQVPVEANNKQEALNKVAEWLGEGSDKIPYDHLEYSHTADVYEWGVMKVK